MPYSFMAVYPLVILQSNSRWIVVEYNIPAGFAHSALHVFGPRVHSDYQTHAKILQEKNYFLREIDSLYNARRLRGKK